MTPVKSFTMLTVLFLVTGRSIDNKEDLLGSSATRRANYLDLKYGRATFRARQETMVVTLMPKHGKPMVIEYTGATGQLHEFPYYLKEAIHTAASLQRYTPDSAHDALSA